MSEKIIPFGKHKGAAISECPIKYLDWLLGEDWFCEKFTDLKADIEEYLQGCSEWQNM